MFFVGMSGSIREMESRQQTYSRFQVHNTYMAALLAIFFHIDVTKDKVNLVTTSMG